MNGFQSFLVRLDGIAETQGEAARAAAMELWERPPEEWEWFRPIGPPQRHERLTLQTPNGPVEIVAHRYVSPGSIVILHGRQVSHFEPRRGVGMGTIMEALDGRPSGVRDLRVALAPTDWADLSRRMAALRLYDATPFPRFIGPEQQDPE